MRPGVPDKPTLEGESKQYPSVQDSLSSFETPAQSKFPSRPAPEEDPIQKTTLDERCGPRQAPTASDSSHSAIQTKIENAHTEQIDTVSTQASPGPREHQAAKGFLDDQSPPDSVILTQNIGGGTPAIHPEDIHLSPLDLSWNGQTTAGSQLQSKLSTGERPGISHYNRTNSFPDVPPLPQSSLPAHSLPHSQAENIMEEDELDDPSPKEDQGHDNVSCAEEKPGRPTQASFFDHRDDASSHMFPRAAAVNGDHALSLADDGARFEEGLPLIHPTLTEEGIAQEEYRPPNFEVESSDPAEDAGDDFFSKTPHSVADEEAIFRPQALDRKTTSQVLDSMQYPPHAKAYDQRQPLGGRQALADPTGGGTAVLSSTVSSPLSEQDHKNEGSSHGDEDLAAIWQAALDDDDLLDKEGTIDSTILVEDYGAGFLDDEPNDTEAQPAFSSLLNPDYSSKVPVQGFSDTNISEPPAAKRYTLSTWPEPQDLPSRDYAPGQTSTFMNQQPMQAINGLSTSVSAPAGFQSNTGQQSLYGDASAQRPPIPSTQSFADKAKGGYTSPYDLPMDITRPKKRNVTQYLRPGSSSSALANRPSAPPRSSSMFASGTSVLETHPPSLPLPKPTKATQLHPASNGASSTSNIKVSAGSFFEELPTVKPRSSAGASRVHGQNPPPNHLSQSPPLPPPTQQLPGPQTPSTSSSSSPSGYGLVPPVRIGPYASVSHQVPNAANVQHVSSKYSPAPVPQSSIPPFRTRYAASPAGSARAPPPVSLPFQPRTSSPLAQSNVKAEGLKEAVYSEAAADTASNSQKREPARQQSNPTGVSPILHNPRSLAQASDNSLNQRTASDSQPTYDRVLSPPISMANRYGPTGSSSTPSDTPEAPEPERLPFDKLHTGLESQYAVSTTAELVPPRRSQTQSPSAVASKPSLPISSWETYQRPASVNDHALPPQVIGSAKTGPAITRPLRGFPQSIEYIRPTDGREKDALERWKGCPLFVFGFGGTIATTFPKRVQRYTAGHSAPLLKCSPGEIKIRARSSYPLDDTVSSFPGPLKSKGKKKDVLDWLQQQVSKMEQAHAEVVPSAVLPDPRKRNEEKILLWRIMKVLVDFDGVIEGKPAAEQEIRLILSPGSTDGLPHNLPPSPNAQLLSISGPNHSTHIPDPTQPGDLEALRRILLQGHREQAVWHALDRRLWAHAMLISSTMDSSVWKQVLQEFIRQEVKMSGENTASLASLYQIFAGNWEESADELVPPSARAGLQFVSKAAGAGPVKNALDGLDRWRETLTLALSNRTIDDSKALVALGRLLSGYGRVEAAHICFIFAKVPGLYGGADDLQASVTLLGADHTQHPSDFSRDVDCILLTEVYEFASTVLALSPTSTISPHLQAYKLYHAMLLAEYGSRKDAQEYCTAITSAMKSTTKPSPYYHSLLFSALDDIVTRLRQAPSAAAASWMSKPSLDKVSGSFLSRVNQFIAGDESDADSVASGRGTDPAAGPFAGIAGDSPNISRSPSSNDIYNTYPSGAPLSSSIASTSRYAPGGAYAAQGQYTPRSSLEQNHGNSQDSRHSSHNDTLRPLFSDLSRPSSSGNMYQKPPQQSLKSSYQPTSQPSTHPLRHGSYPTPPSNPEYVPAAPPDNLSSSLYDQGPSRPMPVSEHLPYQSPYQASYDTQPSSGQETGFFPDQSSPSMLATEQAPYQPLSSGYESALIQGQPALYEPPSASHYEPPSYDTYVPDTQLDDSSPTQEKPKKKAFMDDDDDDFEARAAETLKEEKARKDREADEAFRKAAEADAQKGSELKPKKSGWLGGWFGGAKKDGDLSSTQTAPNAPIRAKLGEESSFVYDKELKKWVNKKAGSETHTTAAATPPPPKGAPSRAVSASGAPTMRKDTEIPPVPSLPPADNTVTPPGSLTGLPSAVPTLVQSPYSSTPVSRSESPVAMQGQPNGPSLGGGLGIMGSNNGPPSAPPSRPATGMSNASSIDDLIGAPQARKGGTIKKGKKGRGYIDVMANK
ncbi:MAG: hypothetical protein Q9195_002603 [Heterodermia aff. obscurata]